MKIRKLYLISLPILIVFNIINVNSGDLRSYGFFIIIIAFSILGLIKNNLKSVLGLIVLVVVTDITIRTLIDLLGGYITETDDGQILPFSIKLIAQIMVLVVSIGLTSLIGGLKYMIHKKNK